MSAYVRAEPSLKAAIFVELIPVSPLTGLKVKSIIPPWTADSLF